MEIQSKHAVPQITQMAPPPAIADQRPTADAAAIATDKTPETPLPVPPSPHQQALVGQAMMQTDKSDGKARPDAPVTAAERTLKPYGISMLPDSGPAHKEHAPEEQT